MSQEITQQELKRVLHYDPETGIFKWIVNAGAKGRGRAGDVAGTNDQGYIKIIIAGKKYRAHRLAFLYMNGNFPKNAVDHIDGNRGNNKWTNLREATVTDNNRNMRLYRRNVTGLHGVQPGYTKRGGWTICFPGGRGWAKDFFEACCIRKSAENRIGFHENHGR